MIFNKAGGKIFSVNLNAAEKAALNKEINRQIAENNRKNIIELDALILWYLHHEYDFTPEQLRKFFDGFRHELDEAIERYELEESDGAWYATHRLKEIGCDIESWYAPHDFDKLKPKE